MGTARWDASTYRTYAADSVVGRSTDQIYTARRIDPDLDPKDISIRESRDSDENPESNAIIVGLDVTGSMGMVLDAMVRGLGTLVEEIYDRKPVTDPHIMCVGIGDAEAGDAAPLQATQFEADLRIAEQLTKIYLERMGGGNNFESYILPWYFAATKTDIDCLEKRGKKGYLFTVGDERITPRLRRVDISRVMGEESAPQQDLLVEEVYQMVSEKYEVFHLMVAQGSYMSRMRDDVVRSWTDVLGQRALLLEDHTKLPEVLVSAIQINEGMDPDEVVASWSGDAATAVSSMVNFQAGLR